MGQPVQPAERADARANHGRLLAAATAVFAEHGTAAEIKEIAERAGLAVGTVYRHFPSKDDLAAAIMEEAVGEFEQALAAALALDDAVAAVRQYVRGGLGIVERYGELMAAVQEGRAPAARRAATSRYKRAALGERTTELVLRGVRAGVFRADLDPLVVAALVKTVFVPWSVAELRRERTLDQIAAAFMDLLLYGAAAAPAASLSSIPLV